MTKAKSTSEAFLGSATEGVRQTAPHLSTARTEAPTLTAGRTLDALIAEKVFGARWEFVTVGNVVARLVAPLPMDWILASQYGDGTVIHAARAEVLPYYSTDIAAAWLVLEHLAEEHGVISEVALLPGGFWKARMYEIDDDDNVEWQGWAVQPTAPHAICTSATKALGQLSVLSHTEEGK